MVTMIGETIASTMWRISRMTGCFVVSFLDKIQGDTDDLSSPERSCLSIVSSQQYRNMTTARQPPQRGL